MVIPIFCYDDRIDALEGEEIYLSTEVPRIVPIFE